MGRKQTLAARALKPLQVTAVKGLRQFLDPEQQRAWLDGEATPPDGDRAHSDDLEQRFKYAHRLEKLLRLPQADDVLDILSAYAATALPIPRTTERFYWSVSCLPGSPDKPLVRVSAGWMELFAVHADNSSHLVGRDEGGRSAAAAAEKTPGSPPANPPRKGEGLRARFILHLSDFTHDGSPEPDQLDHLLLDSIVDTPENVTHFLWKADTFGVKVRSAAAIRAFLAHPHALRAIRRFNLTHMNRGRNAYQASHCYSLADHMLGD
jgi:hypothetical protein